MTTTFLNTRAVETWDTWFRWRDRGILRDRTVEATWQRIADALADSKSGPARSEYQRKLLEAFAGWQLLLDDRIMATAGTSSVAWPAHDLVAVLNAASFVRAPGQSNASLDCALLEGVAALAVYALDDAARIAATKLRDTSTASPHTSFERKTRIGFIGLDDALALLGTLYDSAEAQAHARVLAQALANGCLAGSIALARDHGAHLRCDEIWRQRALARQQPFELIDAAMRYGLRYSSLTAITSQQRLACFANDVADAADPRHDNCSRSYCSARFSRRLPTGSDPASIGADAAGGHRSMSVPAQLQMRAAMQPWIDEPITYPVVVSQSPDVARVQAWTALAEKLALTPMDWRLAGEGCLGKP